MHACICLPAVLIAFTETELRLRGAAVSEGGCLAANTAEFGPFCVFQFLREHLVRALSRKRPGIPLDQFVLHHDNAPGHTAASTQLEIDVLGFQRLPHAPYSPDLAPMDFRVFPVLKDQLRGVHFECGEELVAAAQRIVQQFNSEWYEDTYSMWVRRAEKCVRVKGDYVEKC